MLLLVAMTQIEIVVEPILRVAAADPQGLSAPAHSAQRAAQGTPCRDPRHQNFKARAYEEHVLFFGKRAVFRKYSSFSGNTPVLSEILRNFRKTDLIRIYSRFSLKQDIFRTPPCYMTIRGDFRNTARFPKYSAFSGIQPVFRKWLCFSAYGAVT
jgi:hypothetical protein